MHRIDELKELSPDALRVIIINVASMVRATRSCVGTPLWSIAGRALGTGSTSAHELCKKADLDPGQIVRANTIQWARCPVANASGQAVANPAPQSHDR